MGRNRLGVEIEMPLSGVVWVVFTESFLASVSLTCQECFQDLVKRHKITCQVPLEQKCYDTEVNVISHFMVSYADMFLCSPRCVFFFLSSF